MNLCAYMHNLWTQRGGEGLGKVNKRKRRTQTYVILSIIKIKKKREKCDLLRKHFSEKQRVKVHDTEENKHVNHSRNNVSEVCAEENNNLVFDFLSYIQTILVFFPNEYYIFV